MFAAVGDVTLTCLVTVKWNWRLTCDRDGGFGADILELAHDADDPVELLARSYRGTGSEVRPNSLGSSGQNAMVGTQLARLCCNVSP